MTTGTDVPVESRSPAPSTADAHRPSGWTVGWPVKAALAVAVLLFPWLPGVPVSLVVNANLAGEYALIAMSVVLLTGWVGQISLAQATFAGIGAFTTGILARELGVPFPANLPLAALVSGGMAAALGVVALRVRGLFLAVATLIFAWMADAYLFTASWFVGSGGASSIPNDPVGREGTVTAFDLSNKRVLYVVILAAVAATFLGARALRTSKTGRAFFAIRDSETAAVSLGIDVTRYKLLAFALAGGLAGVAGNLVLVDLRTVTPVEFQFTRSLFFLAVAVVGGITSLGGAVAASVLFAGLNEVFFRVTFLTGYIDIVGVGLLFTVLLGYPGGLGALGTRLAAAMPARLPVRRQRDVPDERRAVTERLAARADAVTFDEAGSPDVRTADPVGSDLARPADRQAQMPVLEVAEVTVRFGGLVAVDEVSIDVRKHEIVGLIGPNGAGKTTLFNAISGLNTPTEGRVRLFGTDVTDVPVHRRAQMGVGRTFQIVQLLSRLTVFENLLVATHVHNPTGVFRHIALTSSAVEAELDARRRVQEVVELLELADVAHRPVAGLPFGILRRVEIARALVTEAPFLMLDEAASGLDSTETAALVELLRSIRASLGLTILLIEHDVAMVTTVSDYMYVLDQGRLIASGVPETVKRDPAVVAAYLGTG